MNRKLKLLLSQDDYKVITVTHKGLVSRQIDIINFKDMHRGDNWRITNSNIERILSAYSHRSLKLFEDSIDGLIKNRIYSLPLTIRAHLETTAQLGYLLSILNQFIQKLFPDEYKFHEKIAHCYLSKRYVFEGRNNLKINSVNILTCIEKSDKILDRLGNSSCNPSNILKDCYEWLSEFCHPNFLSNTLALEWGGSLNEIKKRSNNKLSEKEILSINYLIISAHAFELFYDNTVNTWKEIYKLQD